MRRNEIPDISSKIIQDVCYDVDVDPTLQLLQGKTFVPKTTRSDENVRLDIKANGLCWSGRSR